MFELFANPLNMVVGGALISSPIIIHLINRMRFKRIRWAAMEFLLKSQKRNRRRLIIEQLILLLLRIILVLLTGLLLARFLGASFADFKPQNTVHLAIVDDRLSMSDQWKQEDGTRKNAFLAAKQVIEKEIAKNALLNRSAQRLMVLRLSEVGNWADQQKKDQGTELVIPTIFDQRLNDESMKELADKLGRMDECSQLHLDLFKGVEAARTILGKHGTDQRVLYIVSDFRQRHWFEPEATGLLKALEALGQANVKIHLVDTADPKRSDNQRIPLHHDNLAVVDLRPETRVAAQNSLVQFKFAVANFGASERKNIRVTIKVNGAERAEASQTLQSVPPGKPTEATFLISFDQLGFNRITANLENEDFGVPGDNIRFAVLEVRKQVPLLLIDGDVSAGDKPGGDTFHLRTLFNAARGYEIIRGGVAELERPTLSQYASIYLLNVRTLSEKQRANLSEYVRDGGGAAFFAGDLINVADYNKFLYADGTGLFPAPLADQPSRSLTDEQRQEKILANLTDPQPQLFVRNEAHAIFANTGIDKYRAAFNFLSIERYHPVPRQRWKKDSTVEELMTLPNNRPIGDYEAATQEILKDLQIEDAKYAKYRAGLERHRRIIREKLGGKSLYALAGALNALLQDGGVENDAEQPNLKEFWAQADPGITRLRERIDRFRETVQLGDPLMVAKEFGKGRTVTVFTTAGRKWNDWSSGGPASFTYPMIMLEMQKYLSSLGGEGNLTVGTPKTFELDGSRFNAEMHWLYSPEAQAGDVKPASTASQSGTESNGRLKFEFDRALKAGIYRFDFSPKAPDAGGAPRVESRAFAFNVDIVNESDLRRASKSELERTAPSAVKVQTAGAGLGADVSDRKNDLSESAWLYLLFLIMLVAEQALAVHLSFHLRGNEAALPPQAVRPQPTTA